MASKAINIRLPEADQIKVTEAAKSVGMTVTEYVRFAALNIGKTAANDAVESAAFDAILERLDDLESRLSNTAMGGERAPSSNTNSPSLDDIGEAMTDIYAAQKRTEIALERHDATLQNVVQTLSKIFDHLARSATQPAAPAAARPAPNPTPPAAQQAEAFRRCKPGTVYQEMINSDEQPRPSREDFYRRNLQRVVESVGWDSNVKPDQYAWAGMTPPAGLYDQ